MLDEKPLEVVAIIVDGRYRIRAIVQHQFLTDSCKATALLVINATNANDIMIRMVLPGETKPIACSNAETERDINIRSTIIILKFLMVLLARNHVTASDCAPFFFRRNATAVSK